MFYKCYNNRNILIKGDYIMPIKLVKASIVEMNIKI